MITAHLPAGYCLSKLITKGKDNQKIPYLMPAALLGAIFPDFDLVFFYFLDNQSFHHHKYWVHIPAFWLCACAATLCIMAFIKSLQPYIKTAVVFFLSIFLHLILDTIVGGILWLSPFNDTLYHMVTVPAQYSPWILSFILHWTFLLEIAIWIAAGFMFLKRKTSPLNCID